MADLLYDLGINLLASLIFAAFLFLIERKFRILLMANKFVHRTSPCQFTFACNLTNAKSKDILAAMEEVLRRRNFEIQYMEKGYRTIVKASHENLEMYHITLISEQPFHISFDPVQTTVQSAKKRLTDITSILQEVKDKTKCDISSASLQAVLPYNIGVEIKLSNAIKVTDYRVEAVNKDVKVSFSLDNNLGLHSTDFIQIADTYSVLV